VEAAIPAKKRGIFSFFKRSKEPEIVFTAPAQSPAASSAQKVISAPRSLRESFDRTTVTVAERGSLGGTIDLKQLHVARKAAESQVSENTPSSQAPHVEVQGSVINLRRRQ
jgi:hypothetical protein